MAAIRAATQADLPAIESIVEAAYSPYIARIGRKPGPMLDDYAAHVEAGRIFVLDADTKVQGLVVLVEEAGIVLLDNVAVAPGAHGRGFGRTLIDFAETRARTRGFGAIKLYTHVKMTENVGIYARLGYVETHRATEKGFERVYMRKTL
ncbi:MAG: GNAT family N-acetyltransferase [Proteobacteria bacterium]|nr:GNAT family N-acetyltransferase [Pseudomonadota bacterium]